MQIMEKGKTYFGVLGFALINFWTTMYYTRTIRKNINPENFLRNEKQEFPCQCLESFSGEYYNMGNKILYF